MDINTIFEKFLEDEVNLDKPRHDRIKKTDQVLGSFISNHEDFKDLYIKTTPQGSYRQKTIIKPVGDEPKFDVDLLVELKANSQWQPKDYINKLAKAFKDSGRYEDLTDTDGKTRCVTIDYEGEFHVDLIPTTKVNGEYYIFNKTSDQMEKTDGDGYAQWFSLQDKSANGHLVNVVRLLKYLRDKNEDFDTKSIILTTIAAMQISALGQFNSFPEAFASIVSSMSYFLDKFEVPPSIPNPAMPEETFDRHWKGDNAGFEKLKESLRLYKESANRMLVLSLGDAIKEGRKIFGDGFGLEIVTKSTGVRVVPAFPLGFVLGDSSHKQTPGNSDFRLVDNSNYIVPVTIGASLHFGQKDTPEVNRRLQGTFISGSLLPVNHWLKFKAEANLQPYHKIYWQVVNTGAHAKSQGIPGLRGQIFPGKSRGREQWEQSLYTGIHWIECYVVDTRTQECVGHSDPFYVAFNNPVFSFRI